MATSRNIPLPRDSSWLAKVPKQSDFIQRNLQRQQIASRMKSPSISRGPVGPRGAVVNKQTIVNVSLSNSGATLSQIQKAMVTYQQQMKQAVQKMQIYVATNQGSTNSIYTNAWITGTGSSTSGTIPIGHQGHDGSGHFPPDRGKLYNGRTYHLQDGSKIVIDDLGNYTIEDPKGVITYRANTNREFNKYLNASDLLEEFIAYLGTMGVKSRDIRDISIELFIKWLIIRAAENDGELEAQLEADRLNHQVKITTAVDKPRCLHCGQFISKRMVDLGTKFCSGTHMDAYLSQEQQAASSEQRVLADQSKKG